MPVGKSITRLSIGWKRKTRNYIGICASTGVGILPVWLSHPREQRAWWHKLHRESNRYLCLFIAVAVKWTPMILRFVSTMSMRREMLLKSTWFIITNSSLGCRWMVSKWKRTIHRKKSMRWWLVRLIIKLRLTISTGCRKFVCKAAFKGGWTTRLAWRSIYLPMSVKRWWVSYM